MRVLLIEDDANDCVLHSRALMRAGYDVVTAESGESGLQMALQSWPDVILCDLKMSHGNGYWFAEECKTNEYLAPKPLIAITGQRGMLGDIRRAHEAGFDALLEKPLQIVEFQREVERLCPPLSLPQT
jgi:CheY-like chemotaxis protein